MMKNKFFTKKRIWMGGVGLIVLVVLLYVIVGNKNGSIEKIVVKKGDVVQVTEVSGKTKAASSADLAFEVSGRIVSVPVKVGDKIRAGQILVSLSQSELLADREQAEALFLADQSRLMELEKGTRVEELTIAQTSLSDAERNFKTTAHNTFSSIDDIVRNKIDSVLFVNGQSAAPTFRPATSDYDLTKKIERDREDLEIKLNEWDEDNVEIHSLTQNMRNIIELVRVMLDDISKAVNDQEFSNETNRSALSSARSSFDIATSNFNGSLEKYNTASTNFILKKNGSTPEQISAQAAKVAQSRAGVSSADARLSKYVLVSPINGIITRLDATVGEIAPIGKVQVSVMSDNNFEIEAYVPEVNIGKVSLGNLVSITLDALPGDTFTGKVTYIEPAETVIDGVVNYKIKVVFDSVDTRIKSGLTANVSITTASKSSVLILPRYAVSKDAQGSNVVEKANNEDSNNVQAVQVELGLLGSDGTVEVASGLSEGDVVIVQSK